MKKTQDSQEDFLRREKALKEYFDKISAGLKEKVMITCYKPVTCRFIDVVSLDQTQQHYRITFLLCCFLLRISRFVDGNLSERRSSSLYSSS